MTYDLHKLGWRAFQDLSAVILQRILGQTFHTFADSNDGGRDGAFYGSWNLDPSVDLGGLPAPLAVAAATVVQCKFSVASSGTLTPSMLEDEIVKVAKLHEEGLCDAYVLMTNLGVSGKTEQWLATELSSIGVATVLSLDGRWICQQISSRPDLRRYVPRVYGLGDLGLILNERRLAQARALLSNMGSDLGTFVPTHAYRQAADALAEERFTLLLGAPAAGKSTIAAMLSIAALDEWKCGVMRVDSAAELVAAWDPHDPDQLFWVDDAFGSIRHEPQLTDGWVRRMDQIMTAVDGGARIIMTSRDYIYRQARTQLKEYAYPRLRERAVVVDVAQLTEDERARILYNHLKAGDQRAATLTAWKHRLPDVARAEVFQPEIARRMGLRAFAPELKSWQLKTFVEQPTEFLRQVLAALDENAIAALACVYLAGAQGLSAPVRLSDELRDAILRLGASEQQLGPALGPMVGTFLTLGESAAGDHRWTFRHPTIREGFASMIAMNPNVVHVVISGLTTLELLRQVDCGGEERGTLVRVPPSLYDGVADRIPYSLAEADVHFSPLAEFLTRRCSDTFLHAWAGKNGLPMVALAESRYLHEWQLALMAKLHSIGALPAETRTEGARVLRDRAVEEFDSAWTRPHLGCLLTQQELQDLRSDVRLRVIPNIDLFLDEAAEGWDSDSNPADWYNAASETIDALQLVFEGDEDIEAVLSQAAASVQSRLSYDNDQYQGPVHSSFAAQTHSDGTLSDRNPFDDVAAGHK